MWRVVWFLDSLSLLWLSSHGRFPPLILSCTPITSEKEDQTPRELDTLTGSHQRNAWYFEPERACLNHVRTVTTGVGFLSEYECLSGQTSHPPRISSGAETPPSRNRPRSYPPRPSAVLGFLTEWTAGAFTLPPTCSVAAARRPRCTVVLPLPPLSLGLYQPKPFSSALPVVPVPVWLLAICCLWCPFSFAQLVRE